MNDLRLSSAKKENRKATHDDDSSGKTSYWYFLIGTNAISFGQSPIGAYNNVHRDGD
jgi:propanediol dehydratase large subunit